MSNTTSASRSFGHAFYLALRNSCNTFLTNGRKEKEKKNAKN